MNYSGLSSEPTLSYVVVDLTIHQTLEEINLCRTGSKAIRAELASLEILSGYTTIDFTQEAIDIISAREDQQVLAPAGLILPKCPRQYQNTLVHSPFVCVSSIAFHQQTVMSVALKIGESLSTSGVHFIPVLQAAITVSPSYFLILKMQVVSVFTMTSRSLIIPVSLIIGGPPLITLSPVSQISMTALSTEITSCLNSVTVIACGLSHRLGFDPSGFPKESCTIALN